MKTNIESIRKEYKLGKLDESFSDPDPLKQFSAWLKDAIESTNPEPTSMVISTIGDDGYPQSRVVLMKFSNESGFTFFTNYMSAKGLSIGMNNKIALNFFWPELQRQVRVTGQAKKTSPEVSDAYFGSRPENSRLGAWASEQSTAIPSRKYLEERFEHFRKKFSGKEIERPQYWGGYVVEPLKIEFWQGRENRLHDRILYEKRGNNWIINRLSP